MEQTRKLDIRKQNKTKLANGIPQRSEGSNGDQQIRNTNKGVRLYTKVNNVWYYTSMTKE